MAPAPGFQVLRQAGRCEKQHAQQNQESGGQSFSFIPPHTRTVAKVRKQLHCPGSTPVGDGRFNFELLILPLRLTPFFASKTRSYKPDCYHIGIAGRQNPVRSEGTIVTDEIFPNDEFDPRESLQKRGERLSEVSYVGCGVYRFEKTGRTELEALIRNGLNPWSKLLDIGCGALCGGYWMIHFLDAGGYHGLEPNQHMFNSGVKHILEPGLL